MAVTLNRFNIISLDLLKKTHNFESDTIKMLLSNALPVETNTTRTDITEIASGTGYTAGGELITISSVAESSPGTADVTPVANITITASGGSIGPYQYVAFYNDTSVGDKLIAWGDLGGSFTIPDGNSDVFNFNYLIRQAA